MAKDLEDAASEAPAPRRAGGAPPARALTGVACSVGAYALWGVFPVYFKLVATVPALEVLAHRVVWSVLLVAGLLSLRAAGGWSATPAPTGACC